MTYEQDEAVPQWQESLINDGVYEYTTSSDCDGANAVHWRRTPKRVIAPGTWERITP